ncbi:MAG: hypothetical protein R3B60_03540 [Candidatus Paceibacterota bacterium]
MGNLFLRLFVVRKRSVTLLLFVVLMLELTNNFVLHILFLKSNIAEAATVIIDSSPSTSQTTQVQAGSATVFTGDQVGYRFYRDGSPNSGNCVYSKTTNGGLSWGSSVVVDSQSDCLGVVVWYDRWTPNDMGDYIHIATMDNGDDELFYNRLDTSDDSLLLGSTATSTTLSAVSVLTSGANRPYITKATDGKIFMGVDDGDETLLVNCASNCDLSTNWSLAGTPPQGNANSWSILMPLASGNILLINRSTNNHIRSSVWNGSSWSSISSFDTGAVRNTTYDVGMSATIDPESNDIYLAYVADNNDFSTNDHDIRTAVYSGGSWTGKTDIITNDATRGLVQVAISRDQNNGDLYVGYTARSAIGSIDTGDVYWVKSTDNMASWGSEQGPVNSVSGDLYGVDMNVLSYERIFISWYNHTSGIRDIVGDTISDIGPDSTLSSVGTQSTEVRPETNSFYVGGSFSLNTTATRTVTSIKISEEGTIDADADIGDVKLYYEFDTSEPYDCSNESYTGTESQFGDTVTGGFSGANGSATFTGSVEISPTQSICLYTVIDILDTSSNDETIEVVITSPKDDVNVTGGVDVFPTEKVSLSGTTNVVNPILVQNAYHWRNDDGNETDATSATGGSENTVLNGVQANENVRLRLGLFNEGATTTVSGTYKLEYGVAAPTCGDIISWTEVGSQSAKFNLYDSINLTNGNNTTNVAISSGGVTDGANTFLSGNNAVLDTTSTVSGISLDQNEFIEFEYSIQASSTVAEGETYCFRLISNDIALNNYTNYPTLTITSDITVSSIGTQNSVAEVSSPNNYLGGSFVFKENSSFRNVTSIKLSEIGTVNASTSLSNLRLYYKHDITSPYDCDSESYTGTENQFGATSSLAFSDFNETKTFTDSVNITSTSTLCIYSVFDVADEAEDSETIKIIISSPAIDVAVDSGSVGPSTPIQITSTTTIQGSIVNQANYHWRNDDGNETDATSATGGSENTALENFNLNTPIRLRFGLTNTGTVTTTQSKYQLEYALKVTTCSDASVWLNIDTPGDGWEMYNSSYLTDGDDTTDISLAGGGVSDGIGSFVSNNDSVTELQTLSATTTIPPNDYVDLEFSIMSNTSTVNNTTYCFRVTSDGDELPTYTNYAELTTSPKRDFIIQRGSVQVSGTSTTLLAGTDYTAVASNTRAFVRITNSHMTGSGHDTGATNNQNADDVTVYIEDSSDLITSFTLARPTTATDNTRVDWEIIEFIGSPGTDNEIVVRMVDTIELSSSDVVATGTSLSNISDSEDVVVFITGIQNQNTSKNFYAGQVTSEWYETGDVPVFKRDHNGSSVVNVSYAVIEFIGVNWKIQRVEHTYLSAGTTETESIAAVNSLSHTFIHTQKRMGANNRVVHYGHEVWLSSIGAVSFRLESGASVAEGQTSVAWIIENTQTGSGEMKVQRSSGNTFGGAAPLSLSVNMGTNVAALNNTSINANSRSEGDNTAYPRPMSGFTLTSTSTYQIWRSKVGAPVFTYQVEIIEWPVADLSIRQNYYRFYVDNNALKPTDPWPLGVVDLGENTSITVNDEPLITGDKIRLRMTLKIINANMPAGFQDFKLQYGLRSGTCSAIESTSWHDLGNNSSSTAWRGYLSTTTTDGTFLSTNPPVAGDLLISISDVSGVLTHENPSAVNPYSVDQDENVEYDWFIEQNNADPKSTYCFRMIKSDNTLVDVYNNYPQIRTAGYTPKTGTWRWYDDAQNETPISPLAAEESAPVNVPDNDDLTLRISVSETKNIQGSNVKFKLQYSEDANFSDAYDVAASDNCVATSSWCYVDGGGVDNEIITTSVLSGNDVCVSSSGGGCGTHNTVSTFVSGHTHEASTTKEYSFTLKGNNPKYDTVYYFRVYDVTFDEPVPTKAGFSYPSLVTEGTNLVFTVSGLPSGTSTAGIITDISTTPNGIEFGSLLFDTNYEAAHRITIDTNASKGYQIFKFASQQFLNNLGTEIPSITGSNISPTSWTIGCQSTSTGCVGYHTTDGTLKGGSTRFAADDTFAGLETLPTEIMYSSIPATESHDIVYRVRIAVMQEFGDYQTEIVYLAVPSF